jgi:hypothetical protein
MNTMPEQTVDEERVCLNGLDASTGHYLEGPQTLQELADMAQFDMGQRDKKEVAALKNKSDQEQASFGVEFNVDENDLAQSGWGVIFADDAKPELREALSELLDYRHDEAGDLYREYWKRDNSRTWTREGYKRDETWDDFRVRQQVGSGLANPRQMPYYLLIVGAPQNIPFSFQYLADVQRAIGRIDFGDDLNAYRRYAHSVVEAERAFAEGRLSLPRRATFFSTANKDDGATARSYEDLTKPVHTALSTGDETPDNWMLDLVEPDQASKPRLKRVLGGAETPAIMFTATHGLGFSLSDPRLKDDRTLQFRQQGALVCKEWPGPNDWGAAALPEKFYLSADDIDASARLWGSIAIHFACFGAGTPALNEYVHRRKELQSEPMQIAPEPFVAGLPKRLLSHPNGGALAVVGHVDRAWTCSFRLANVAGGETEDFDPMRYMLLKLMYGMRVGFALESINARYADRATSLTQELSNISYGKIRNDFEFSRLWTANNDARSYTVIGDPAVRLPLSKAETAWAERPTVQWKPDDQPYSVQTGSSQVTPAETSTLPSQIESQSADFFLGRRREASRVDQAGVATAPGAVQQFIDRLGEALRNAVTEASTVQVTTYVSAIEDTAGGDQVQQFLDARCIRGVTRVSLNGSIEETLTPDETWQAVHRASVDQATKNRNELLNTAVAALVGLFTPAKGS